MTMHNGYSHDINQENNHRVECANQALIASLKTSSLKILEGFIILFTEEYCSLVGTCESQDVLEWEQFTHLILALRYDRPYHGQHESICHCITFLPCLVRLEYVWVDNRTLSQKILLALEGRKMESKHWKYSCVRAKPLICRTLFVDKGFLDLSFCRQK